MAMPLTHRSYPKRWTAYDVRALMEASPTHWPRYEAIDGELIVTEYWVVDLGRRLVERWRPGDRHAEVLTSSLIWHPPGPNEPLTIDLVSLFGVVRD
jgi:hypothetical protein